MQRRQRTGKATLVARKFTGTILAAGLIVGAALSAAAQQTHRYTPKKDELKYHFGVADPVLRVQPGDTIETYAERTDTGYYRQFGDTIPPDAPPNPYLPNPVTGPFYIEGAEPGDTLVVRLLEIEPAEESAIGFAGPGFGGLTKTRYTQMLDSPPFDGLVSWAYKVDRQARTVEFAGNFSDVHISLPLQPFLGCLGVAPLNGEVRQTTVPGFFGGNLDTPEVRAGTTVYLPVNVPGALLYLGDGHAVQGEGEIAGTAAEIAMNVRLQVDLIKGKTIATPRLEDDTHLMTAGSTKPLEDAMRVASREMVAWLVEDYGFAVLDAYEFLSVAAESNVSQLVDPNYTILVKLRKEYLPLKKK